MLFFFPSLEHDSDGENDSENSDGGNEYQDDDDDDDDGDDGEGFATRKSVGKHFFMWEVFGWCLSFFLSFFLSRKILFFSFFCFLRDTKKESQKSTE